MTFLLDWARRSPSFTALGKTLKTGESALFESLWDSPKALIAAFAAHETGKPILLITGGTREDLLFDNLETISPGLAIEYPAWETLPGEEIAPSPDIIGKRFDALRTLLQQKRRATVFLCPLQSLLQKTIPKESLSLLLTTWKKGTRVAFANLPGLLTEWGYKRVPLVSDKGQFALRGGILDLFPVESPDPFRIEFWGDAIEEIRTFDPMGQKSIGRADEIRLSCAQEQLLLQKAQKLCPVTDYLGEDFLLFWDDLVAIEDTYVSLKGMPGANSPFLYSLEDLFKRMGTKQHILGSPQAIEELSAVRRGDRSKYLQSVTFEAMNQTFEAQRWFHAFQRPLDFFSPDGAKADEWLDLLPKNLSTPTFFLNTNVTEEEEIKRQIARRSISLSSDVHFERGGLSSGFVISDLSLAILPNAEITGRAFLRRQKWRNTVHTPAVDFPQLTPGDLVVHFHSGIGRYIGIEQQTDHLGARSEFLALQYAEGGKLFVPLAQSHLISRYIGAHEEIPSLSQLGSKRWQAAKLHAQKQILGYANDLLQMYAERVVHGGFAYPPDGDVMRQFENDFPYPETSDQAAAIQSVKKDMIEGKPMDRLICGDVGYGKTEVAIRAAFKTVVDGHKQVAVLVPTTVLAMQHHETFCRRMHGFPVRIGVLSRFQTAKQHRETLAKMASGEIDILIGTHRLLSKDVQFKELGLLIIDEEQRFGVRAKEHLKHLKKGVNCLTLSATPIPRTLYISLIQVRDMSVINTPPQDRLPVKTIIAETENDLIQNALMREFARGGQAFYIHNRVETIAQRAEAIQKLVPSARIGAVHGQMDPDAVDPIFHSFQSGEIDLLFATTIVENGVDIPNANTILIDRADTYGLADLYQLRGRVGRWNRAAYAYFLIPQQTRLPELARKRLNALVEAGGYGGGMRIAMRDLEIRGSGDLLGVQQSGQISSIGFHLYCKLLKRAVEALKKKAPVSFNEARVEFSFDARIPDFYIPETSLRMELYHRLGEASTSAEITALGEEIEDRFGPPPEQVLWLYSLSRIRAFASINQFSWVKIQPSLLTAEQLDKKDERKTIPLPSQKLPPLEFGKFVIERLRGNFPCPKSID